MDTLIEKVELDLAGLEKNLGMNRPVKFLLAVSAGMDSMVMADVFIALRRSFGVAHFNFKLRGKASDLDEELVRMFCQHHHIPFHTRSTDTARYAGERKISVQEAARELRYEFFSEVADSDTYDIICTAHHGNDQLETFFINMFRGSGLKGLTGIPRLRGRIFRPMLWIPRAEIEQYCQIHHVRYREDASNRSDKYLRNRIRHQLIPAIENTGINQLGKALSTIGLLTEYQEYIDIQLNQFKKRFVHIYSSDISRISRLTEIAGSPSGLFMMKLFLLDQGVYVDSVEDIVNHADRLVTGSQYEGGGLDVWVDRDSLWLINEAFFASWDQDQVWVLDPEGKYDLEEEDYLVIGPDSDLAEEEEGWVIPLSLAHAVRPLLIRHRRPGDKIMLGPPPFYHKSLKKLLNEIRIPRPFKDRIYVLTDAGDQIISVVGLVNSPRFTSDDSPDLIIQFKISMDFILGKG